MKKRFIKALSECAKAHNYKGKYYREDDEFAIPGAEGNIPTYSDVRSIVKGFTGSTTGIRETTGMILVELWQMEILPENEIDWPMVQMALPFGTKI